MKEGDGEAGAALWRRLGVPNPVAMVRAGYHSLDDLAGVTREEFLAHSGLGDVNLARCEALLARSLPSYRAAWLRRGLPDGMARRLSSLRIAKPEELGDFAPAALKARGFTKKEIDLLRRWAGVVSSFEHWRELGCAHRLANALDGGGIRTLEELAALTREELLSLKGLPDGSVPLCEKLLGHPLPSALDYWTGHRVPRVLAWQLSRKRVMTIEDLRRRGRAGLRRLGLKERDVAFLAALAAAPPG